MSTTFQPPQSDVFGFFIFTLVGGFVGVLIKDETFRHSTSVQYLTTICLVLIAFVIPAVMCLHLSLSEHSAGPPSWKSVRIILFIEAGVDLMAFMLTTGLLLLKIGIGHTSLRKAGITELFWYINAATYDAVANYASQRDWTLPPPPPAHQFFIDRPLLWCCNMTYFFIRFVLLYTLFIPFSVACNLYVAFNLITSDVVPNVIKFDDSIFFILFGAFLICFTSYFCCKYNSWQAWVHFILIFHSFLICYFVTDSSNLARTLLGALAIYFATIYDMITDKGVDKTYNTLSDWCCQMKVWIGMNSLDRSNPFMSGPLETELLLTIVEKTFPSD